MPISGAWVLSDFRGAVIRTECKFCDRCVSEPADVLIDQHGPDANMPGLLTVLADKAGCDRTTNAFYERCGMIYCHIPDDRLSPHEGPRHKTLADIPEWWQVFGRCSACKVRKEIDIRRLSQRYGAQMEIRTVAQNLKCSSCGNRTDNRLLKVKRPR